MDGVSFRCQPREIYSLLGANGAGKTTTLRMLATRPFPVLLVCGARDHNVPCRHSKRLFEAATGPKQLWVVRGAGHAAALGKAPAEFERRVLGFFRAISSAN